MNESPRQLDIGIGEYSPNSDCIFCSGKRAGPMATTISIAKVRMRAGRNLFSLGGLESTTSDIKAKECWLSELREMKVFLVLEKNRK